MSAANVRNISTPRWLIALFCCALVAVATTPSYAADATKYEAVGDSYAGNTEAKAFVEAMVKEGFDRAYLEALMADAKPQDSIIKAISRPAERTKTWGEYRPIFLGSSRVEQGVQFWDEHEETINRASAEYGVPPQIIVAIIGVETRYGRHAGRYRVLDALATLGFDYPPRSKFFSKELKEFLYLVKEENLDPKALTGSYAGAMGYGQFISSSYRNYAVDFDGDGQRNILTNPVDAIGSVANYFKRHGWQQGEPVTVRAKVVNEAIDEELFNASLKPVKTLKEWQELGVEPAVDGFSESADNVATAMKMQIDDGAEYWLGLHNFYVITRYNHSRLYAMAVYQLSEEVLRARTAN